MRLAAPLVLLFVLTAAGGPAWAAPPAEREARALFRRANQLYQAREYLPALEMFRAAYRRLPSPKILLNIGTTLRQLGRHAQAAATYDSYLADAAADPAKRAQVQGAITELAALVGRVRVEVAEPGARVLVDGSPAGESPLARAFWVEPGVHTVVAERDGRPVASVTLTLRAGEERVAVLKLEPAPTTVSPGTSTGRAAPLPTSQPAPARAASTPRMRAASSPPSAAASRPAAPAPVMAPAALAAARSPARGALGERGGPTASVSAAAAARPPTGAWRLGAFARADLDYQFRGAAAAVGLTCGLGHFVEVAAAGLLGPTFGFGVQGTAYLGRRSFRPLALVGVPVYFSGGARAGVQGALGVDYSLGGHVGLFLLLGVQYFPSVPAGMERTLVVPALGVRGRL